MKKVILLGSIWLTCAVTAFPQDGINYWKRMKKSHPEVSLDELVKKTATASSLKAAESKGLPGYRLSLVYGGEYRNITPTNVALIQKIGLKAHQQKQYKYELLFKHNGQEVWLPVQTKLIEQLELELRENEPVVLYTKLLPATTPTPDNAVALLVEEYQVK